MKKFFTGIFAIAVMGFSAFAQEDKKESMDDKSASHGERKDKGRFNMRLLEQLDLTATQKDQLKVINEEYRSKMQDMIKSDMTPEERKAQRNIFENDRKKKTMAILTPEQIVRLRELQSEMADRRDDKSKDDKDDKTEYKYKEKKKAESAEVKIKMD